MIMASLANIIIPLLVKETIDHVIPEQDGVKLIWMCVAFAAVIVISAICLKKRILTVNQLGQTIIETMRKDLFVHLQKLPFSFYDDRPHGKIIVRVVNYVNSVSDLLSGSLVNVLAEGFSLIIVLIIMFCMDPVLTLVCLAAMPIMIFVVFRLKTWNRVAWQRVSNKSSNLNAYVHESLAGMRVTQSFVREAYNAELLDNVQDDYRKTWMRAIRLNNLVTPSIEIISVLANCAVILTGVSLMQYSVSAGTLIAFLRMAGFEAYPAMTMAGSRVESIPADHFNHCVAVVKLSSGTYMPLDPTWVPFCRELWSSAEQQQNYLPGVPEGSDLCLTPVSAPENHYVRIKANNRLDAKGTLTGQFTITAEGQSDSNIRRIFTTGWQSQWQAALESQLLAVSPKARLISVDYGKDPKNYQAAPIKMTFRYEIPGYALSGEREMLFKPMVMNNLYNQVKSYLRINTDLEERRYGFKDACSRLVELDETIQLPTGYKLAGNGKEDSVQSSAADFEGSLRQDGNKVVLHQKLALKKRVYEAGDWNGFRNAVNAHKSFGDYIVIKR